MNLKADYNIIFTKATIPTVLSGLLCLGKPTFVMIERGKTFKGIDKIDEFENLGFDTNSNLSNGFSEDQFNIVLNKVKELNKTKKETFNIFIQDGQAFLGLALALKSGLEKNQYKIIICEDGTASYIYLENHYIKNKILNSTNDEIHENFKAQINLLNKEIEAVKNDKIFNYEKVSEDRIERAFLFATMENFIYVLQNKNLIKENLLKPSNTYKTKLLSNFGFENNNNTDDFKVNFHFISIDDLYKTLNQQEKEKYLNLMFGDSLQDVYNIMRRKSLPDNSVAKDKKLLFTGTLLCNYPKLATDKALGIGKASLEEISNSYDELDKRFKNVLLFDSEEHYKLFIEEINNMSNYSKDITKEQLNAVKVECFNKYIDYIFILKLTYFLYNSRYDIVIKSHPREIINTPEEWTIHYEAKGYNYDKLLSKVILNFHSKDCVGKNIGYLLCGTSIENLKHLNLNFSLCGLPSSAYISSNNIDIEYVLNITNNPIFKDEFMYEKYKEGNFCYHLENKKYSAIYMNTGNLFKTLYTLFEQIDDKQNFNIYYKLYKIWIKLNAINYRIKTNNIKNLEINLLGEIV